MATFSETHTFALFFLKGRYPNYLFCLIMVLVLVLTVTLQAKEKKATLDEGWDLASRLLINDGYEAFSRIHGDTADQRAIDYGLAATLISVQPKTSGNIEKASALLESIIKSNPEDELSIYARYLLARIAQTHMLTPDEPLALKRFDELIALNPLHPLVQLAMTKRALLRVYQLDETTPLLARYKQAVKESSQVTEPGARRDYMLMLANVSVRLDQPEEVTLEHLLEAELCQNFRPRSLADLYVRIGGFAEAAGKKALAKEYYEKFLEKFLRDNRRFLIQEKLANLKSAGEKS